MRVLVSGYYGFQNLGDEALLEGLTFGLRELGHTPVVLSSNPAVTSEQHGVEAAHRVRGLLGAVLRADAVVSGGGGLLQDKTSARSLNYYLGVIRLGLLAGKRVVVYGQSLGPLSPAGRRRVARALRGVPLALRDELSIELARELGLEAFLVGDPALLLSRVSGAEAGGDGGRPYGSPVVLVPRGGEPGLNAALGELAEVLSARGVPLAAMAFHECVDGEVVAELRGRAPGLVVWRERDPTSLVGLLRGARFVVSARLHGCILAAAAGVGFAGLSYDPKVDGFAALAGAPVFSDPVDVDALVRWAVVGAPLDSGTVESLASLSDEGIDWLGRALSVGA